MVAKPRTTLPVAGVLTNFNTLVGRDGVVGVKTGSSNAAGGCLAIAALRPVAGRPTLVYAVVLGVKGANATQAALSAGKVLVDATGAAVGQAALLPKGQQVATVQVPWGKPVPAVTATATELPGWGGMPVTMTFHQGKLPKSLPAGAQVGTLEVHVGAQRADVPIVTTAAVHPAPLRWRLRRSP
jgi:D-alanyl-D-alanine carboxypeptidase (penicillin-binding protein 5/6)